MPNRASAAPDARAPGAPGEVIAPADRRYLAAAIRLGRRNEGLTADNPSVGCLIVRDGRIVGRGVTAPGGRPHAEVVALAEAGGAARGATAYVSLEPCAHHGRSPPCADALVAAGIARVVIALRDPFARVDGRGIARLRAAGIPVTVVAPDDSLATAARDGMAGFLAGVERARPHVLLKLAVSAEGWLGREGDRVAITGPIAAWQTQLTRARADAILVGIGTALADDPSLTVRLPGMADRSPMRMVLDPRARLPLGSALVRTARDVPVIVIAADDAPPERIAALEAAGCAVERIERRADGAVRPSDILARLFTRGVRVLMVEGGAAVARSFLEARLVDEIALFAGRAIGDDPSSAAPVASPLRADEVAQDMQSGFGIDRALILGPDRLTVLRTLASLKE